MWLTSLKSQFIFQRHSFLVYEHMQWQFSTLYTKPSFMQPKAEWCFLAICLLHEGGKYTEYCGPVTWRDERMKVSWMRKDGLPPWLLAFCISSGCAISTFFVSPSCYFLSHSVGFSLDC